METELNEYKNDSKKRQKSSGSEALDRQTVEKSFSDRICDLCEEILQYLPLEHKLRLECVSKQFQRTAFVKQYSLSLNLDDNIRFSSEYNEIEKKEKYMKSVESVLKKCPKIRRFDSHILETENLRSFKTFKCQTFHEIRKNIIQLLTKYCNHLTELIARLYISKDTEFYQKFGSKLEYFSPCSYFLYFQTFELFPNQQIFWLNLKRFDTFDEIPLELRQLKRLTIYCPEEKEHMVREVLQKFNKITHLSLDLYTDFEKSALNSFQDSPLLQNLIELKIIAKDKQKCVSINCLKQMEKKFPNLKSIEISYKIVLENISDFEELMSSLKTFPHLKRLDIILEFKSGLEFDKLFSFKGFPQQLTHLSLDIKFEHILNETHFKDIDIYLPKLQFLCIKSQIITDEKGVTQMAGILSGLSFLQSIDLWLTSYPNSELMTAKIIEKCRKIRKISTYKPISIIISK